MVIGARVDLVRGVGLDRLVGGWFGRESILRVGLIYLRFALPFVVRFVILRMQFRIYQTGRQRSMVITKGNEVRITLATGGSVKGKVLSAYDYRRMGAEESNWYIEITRTDMNLPEKYCYAYWKQCDEPGRVEVIGSGAEGS